MAVATAMVVMALLLSGCGSSSRHTGTANVTAPPTTSGPPVSPTSLPATRPDTCAWLDRATALGLAGVEVRMVGTGAATYWPNIVCQYATPTASGQLGYASIALVATYLQTDGHAYTAAEWDRLVHSIDRLNLPLALVGPLSSAGYYGWSFGPTRLSRSSDRTSVGGCGFAKAGYAYQLGGQWTNGVQAPVQDRMIAACEKIKSEI